MHGFKSFAKFTELPFGDNFNCVLGPNGSGKSNVLDAICFVLGKSSTKSLRAEKSANLIYNGGKSKKPAKQGEVSIYFDNADKVFPTEDAVVKVTRIVKQSGQSAYKINDKVRTRQQIVDLLAVAKIDPNGYNIILQGDIVRFTEMPSIERRQLIEEISGISVYEEKKHKALHELDKVQVRLNDAELILGERQMYLKDLKKDYDHALKYKEMADKIKQNEASYLKIQIDNKEKEQAEFKGKMSNVKQDFDEVNAKILELKTKNQEKRVLIDTISKDIEQKGEHEQVALTKNVENLKIELTKTESRVAVCKNELSKIEQRKKDLQESIKELDEKIAELSQKKQALEKEREARGKENNDFAKKIQHFKEKNKIEGVGDIEKQVEKSDEKAEELQKKIQQLRVEQQELIRKKDSLQYQLNTVDEQIKKVQQIEKEHHQQIEDLKNKRQEFKQTTLELNKKLDEDSGLANQLSLSREKLTKSHEELAKLQARNTGIQEGIQGDIAVKKILEQKNAIRGIFGTVAELGKVSSKYALALEIAAGPRIKSIVVEDDKAAADCIKYLKANRLGTATFLPLNKIISPPIKAEIVELEKAKGVLGQAIELVEFDKKYSRIFSYVFANTLIVENIDVARRIGIGKAKMVTLDGDLAEFSGAMHGGFREKKARSGFIEKELTKDIDEYEEAVAALSSKIAKLEKQRAENETLITGYREKKAHLEGEIIKSEKSLHLEPGEVDISRRHKQEIDKNLELVDKEMEDIEQRIAETNKELTAIKIEKQTLRAKITELRDPVLLAELRAFEERRIKISEDVIRIESEIKGNDTEVSTIRLPEKEKIAGILKQLALDETNFAAEITELKSKMKTQTGELKDKEEKAKKFYTEFRELFEKRKGIEDEIQRNNAVIEKKDLLSRELEIKLNTLSLKNSEITVQLEALNHEFEQYHGVELFSSKTEEELKRDIAKFKKLQEDIGSVNMRALDIYDAAEKEYKSLLEKKDTLLKEKEQVINLMNELEGKKKELFMKTYDAIESGFKRIFSTLNKKGDAELELENKENPFEGGLEIKVRIVGTKYLDIRSLSGGEKTLTALSFIFAIQEYEPASFYILDEVDAALDKHNSEKFAKLIAKYAQKAQYIIISHNDSVISEASHLFGVSMDENAMTKVVSLKI
jgi:chromosome segregation protein